MRTKSITEGNEINLMTGKRLSNVPSINENIQKYNNCCNMFEGEDFLNANPYDVTSKEGRAWNLGYSNQQLTNDLKDYKSSHTQGNIQRYIDLAKGGLQIADSLIDIYGNIKKQNKPSTEESDIDVDITLGEDEIKKQKDAEKLKIIGGIAGGVILIVVVGLIVKKARLKNK